MLALSVELQRANSRMILERSPHVDNLIDADIVKCQQSITMKRVKAIESLWFGVTEACSNLGRRYVNTRQTKNTKAFQKILSERKMCSLRKPNIPPQPPEPPDRDKEVVSKDHRRLHYVVEERILATKSYLSRNTSTLRAQVESIVVSQKRDRDTDVGWKEGVELPCTTPRGK